MTEHELKERYQVRSIPRSAYVHIRCLHCGEIRQRSSMTLLDESAREFLATVFDHTAETGHKVEVTSTESFTVDQLR